MAESSNFAFLREHDPVFFQLAATAERVFASDPNTTLIKLRQLGEALAQDLAARAGIEYDATTAQADLLFRLGREIQLDGNIRTLFHTLRVEGNKATHGFRTQHREALDGLKVARALAVWYHQSFGETGGAFKPGPFVTPADPSAPLRELQTQIEQLRTELGDSRQQLESNQQLAELLGREKDEYSSLAEQMDEEARIYQQIALEHEAQLAQTRAEFEARLHRLQKQLDSQPQVVQQVMRKTQQASSQFDLTEDLTRILIDQQLNDAGWTADSLELTWSKGARPEKGKHKAIAEWPTSKPKENADYVLFAGLVPVAIVEAKRKRINIANRIPQAERYARQLVMPARQQPCP